MLVQVQYDRFVVGILYLEALVVACSWKVDGQGDGAENKGVELSLEGIREWASSDTSNLPECR